MALQTILEKINKTYGKNTINRVKDLDAIEIERISTGSLKLDMVLKGGYPRGRIIEIYGPESSGKTTLALHSIAEVQRNGGNAAFIDAEHALDLEYAEALGIDTDALIISQPDYGEQALEIADMLARSKEVDIIVIDSVSALVPKSELEGEMGDASVGKQARLMSQAMRKLPSAANKSGTTIIFINQIRMKIGVMFGNPETTSGGNALKFAASVRLDVRRSSQVKDGQVVVGNDVKIKVVKNKTGRPYQVVDAYIEYGKGFVKEKEVLDLAVDLDIIQKAGSWFSYRDTKLGQGKVSVIQLLRDNPELTDELIEKILKNV